MIKAEITITGSGLGRPEPPTRYRRWYLRLRSFLLLLLRLHFAQSCGFALEFAQVEQLGAADLVGPQHFNFVDDFGIQRENALHTLAEADFADREAALRAVAAGNDCAFKCLNALFVAFFDPYLDADGVSRLHAGDVLALQLGGKPLEYWML